MTKYLDATALRRELHEMPELAMQEHKTAAYVAQKLRELGIETTTGIGGTTGVLGIIHGSQPGPVVMLRADMDALPFKIDGKDCAIHACGHDAHTATLLAVASRLVGRLKRGTVKFLFQPTEENLKGAPAMAAAGVIDDVDVALGAHIRPVQDVPTGMMCPAICHTASTTAYVTVEGRSAHAARPHLGVNAIDIASAIVQAVNSIWLDPTKIWSPKATQLHADSGATNSVPDNAKITFDMRAQTNPLMKELCDKMTAVVENTAAAFGGKAVIEFGGSCPAAEYDDEIVEMLAQSIQACIGEDKLAQPCGGGGEDFHFYKLHKPELKAGYFGIGVGATPGLHAANMSFDDTLLPMGVSVFVDMVDRLLGVEK